MKQILKKSIQIFLTAGLVLLSITACATLSPARPEITATTTPEMVFTPPQNAPDEMPTTAPLPSQTPTEVGCLEIEGRIESQVLNGADLARPLPYRVYLPPCYNPDQPGGYPVLFLLHGQNMTEAAWQELGIQETADRLIVNQETVPFLIVMPREEYYLQEFSESVFDNALIEALLPAIAGSYSTSSERNCRAIGGISRGASWALVLGWNHWKEFGAIGAHSVPNAPFSPSRLRALKESISPGDLPRIRIDIGEADRYFKGAQQLHTLFDQLNIPHQWLVQPGAHNMEYWQIHLESCLRWYAVEWNNRCVEGLP